MTGQGDDEKLLFSAAVSAPGSSPLVSEESYFDASAASQALVLHYFSA